ncbi:Protein of unknown function (DUF2905) [Salsuginibacillus halophilus]|uniref:DUF2905 family protein n=1 Tax=Salsuginibacillus halophilus TaxID=517424 RepID=A0A2P8HFY9_9BACI|nr:DUF2905 domain-containing protein [Salsuginibacillus halophilus]PSL45123.1 Protein of unknown function (DUF2905) [Salsuginibacillus halophilus]
MPDIPRLLIGLGILLVLIGIIWQVGGRFLPIGKLPGDFIFRGENATFYFPLVTSIIISVLLSLIFMVIGRFR